MPLVPPVVEKQVVDIDLGAGVNERARQELVDWTKQLTTEENAVLDDWKAIRKRPGMWYLSLTDYNGGSYTPPYRLLPQDDGVAFVGKDFTVFQYNEANAAVMPKNRAPEWGVSRNVASSWGSVGANQIRAIGCNSAYRVLIHESGVVGGAFDVYSIIIQDRYSGTVVRKYVYTAASAGGGSELIGCVSGDILHIFVSDLVNPTLHDFLNLSSTMPDQTTWPTGGAVNLTNPAGAVSTLGGCYPMDSGAAVVAVYSGAGTTDIETFNSAGASTATRNIAVLTVTGVASDGSRVYVAGLGAGPVYNLVRLTSSLVVSSTVVSTFTGAKVRVVTDGSDNCYLVGYDRQVSPVAGIYYPKAVVFSCATGAAAFTEKGSIRGWCELTQPFYSSAHGRYYVTLGKQMSGHAGATVSRDASIASSACVVDITGGTQLTFATGGAIEVYFRPSAAVDTYTASMDGCSAEYGYMSKVPPLVASFDAYNFVLGIQQKATSRSYTYDLVDLRLRAPVSISSHGDVIGAGICQLYDGDQCQEIGFVEAPSVFGVVGGAGNVNAGAHNYVAVLEYKDLRGGSHFSRISRPSTVTPAIASVVTLAVPLGTVTSHDSRSGLGGISVHYYRTTAGGTVYYYVGTSSHATGALVDTVTDAVLVGNSQLFRQPGIQGTALDRHAALAGTHIVRHKDRVFYANGSNVYYSSFAVDGEAPWFNPSFSFAVPGGAGHITALASMDGVLVVFKRNAVFVVDGDGPPENGGNGTEFSPPRKVLTEFGCVDQRTVVYMPKGIMYRSSRGIELLDRSLQVQQIGQDVQTTTNTYPYSGGACFDPVGGKCLFVIGEAESNGIIPYASNARVLCYDVSTNAWTTWKPNLKGADGYHGIMDVCSSSVHQAGIADQPRVMLIDESYLGWLHPTNHTDYGWYVPLKLETGWVRFESAQDRVRISDFLVMAKRVKNHNLSISVAYDYSDTYSYTKTFTPATINSLSLEQLELQVPQEAKMAMRFKVEDAAPADLVTYPIDTGDGPHILALSPRLGKRGGGARLSADQKG